MLLWMHLSIMCFHLRRDESKEISDFIKVEERGVHCKKHNDHCMKKWVRIPKAIWTSPILKKRSTCWISFNRVSLIKDDVSDEVPNGTLKILIPFNGMVNWDGVLKFSGRLKGDHATHFWGWIERPITYSLVWKCLYVDDTIERGPMMWVSSTMDGNKQEKKSLIIECKYLKWVKVYNTFPKGFFG